MNSELDSPPFDPTPVDVAESGKNASPQYSILVRSYPESGQTETPADYPEFEPSFWESLFGDTKATLRRKLTKAIDYAKEALEIAQKTDLENQAFQRRIEILKKQVAIWEKTYTTVSELAQQRIQDIATLRHQLTTANDEIERRNYEIDELRTSRAKSKPKAKRK